MSPPSPPLLNGAYELLDVLGEGTYGAVYRCRSKQSGDLFACKSIDKSNLLPCYLDKEASVMGRLSGHPHILRLHSFHEDARFIHLILDLCDSSNLMDQIIAAGHFDENRAVEVMTHLMRAIAHCHAKGVVHLDVKPDNILFHRKDGRLQLADFGVAQNILCTGRKKLLSILCTGKNTKLRGLAGTPCYMAPEVVDSEYSEKADIWSAGAVFYHMLAGSPPFDSNTNTNGDIYRAIKHGDVQYPANFSPAVTKLLSRMLCKDASRRLSAKQVLVPELNLLLEFWIVIQSIARIGFIQYLDPSFDFVTLEPNTKPWVHIKSVREIMHLYWTSSQIRVVSGRSY